MTTQTVSVLLALCIAGFAAPSASAGEPLRDRTCFQSYAPYSPELDIAADLAIVYGVDATFNERVRVWREKGYNVGMMTGIAWGAYERYYGDGEAFKKAEVQTRKDGSLFMHHPGVGYNVPTEAYVEFIKEYVAPAVDAGVQAVFLEEPEFWARTGWSEAFKQLWQARFGEPWVEPDSSPDAQYKASRLKYELYFDALRDVFAFIKQRARDQGRTIECIVPTHSMINYAQWRIVSPESHLIDIPELDGYIAQVWTGTARSHNRFRGIEKERTFETAYLEFGQMAAMVRPTGKKVWFLADPVEDNPNHSWADYKKNYECTVVASLMWPEVSRYEVMPWPDRIFQGQYPVVDMQEKSGQREGIPADYATEILTVINALNDMEQADVRQREGRIGVVVSDTLMFQRAAPHESDPGLACFYGLALPLLKSGIPVKLVQLENVLQPGCFDGLDIIFLTYEGQKPLKPEYHDAIAAWVRRGGALILVDDGADPYHGVREWWNDSGQTSAKAFQHLLQKSGLNSAAVPGTFPVGDGLIVYVSESPTALSRSSEGAAHILTLAREAVQAKGKSLDTSNYHRVDRGPYVIAAVMDESESAEALRLTGEFVDLFDPRLPIVTEKTVNPDERALLVDVAYVKSRLGAAPGKVLAASTRIREEIATERQIAFTARGPVGTTARVRVLLQAAPAAVETKPGIPVDRQWDGVSNTLFLSFANRAEDIRVDIVLP